MMRSLLSLIIAMLVVTPSSAVERGYYRHPALYGDVVVFTAEGDLWTVGLEGGVARRLTTHAGVETHAAIDPTGANVAFSAQYEGATEAYVMPLAGGEPTRLTYDGGRAWVVGWTPDGAVLVAGSHGTGLPRSRVRAIDTATGSVRYLPLDGVGDATLDPADNAILFTRFATPGSHFKRYRGGRAQTLWRLDPQETDAAVEATPLTQADDGASRTPMVWSGRVYFASDRDGTFNVWSIAADGANPRQHTHHQGWDVREPSLGDGRIVYQLGADLHVYDIASGTDRALDIVLASDFDQRRERWVQEPMDYLTAAHLSPDGDQVVLTARGQVFVLPVKHGRRIEVSHTPGVRHRAARFLPTVRSKPADSKAADSTAAEQDLIVLSDATGEVELWRLDARGVRPGVALTDDGAVLRYDTLPSPDGTHVAYVDHDQALWLLEIASGTVVHVDTSSGDRIGRARWSPDSRWLAYGVTADNLFSRIRLYDTHEARHVDLTSDRFDSYDPAWSADGRFLYFLSDRHLASATPGPWGSYAPGPNLDARTQIYLVDLAGDQRSPFQAPTELDPPTDVDASQDDDDSDQRPASVEIVINLDGLGERLARVPLPPGNLRDLEVGRDHLFWRQGTSRYDREPALVAYPIDHKGAAPTTLVEKTAGFEIAENRKMLLTRTGDQLLVMPANGETPTKLDDHVVSLTGWRFPLDPGEEWRQMLTDAWRLLRDYFYDPGMHGVDWQGVLARYQPLIARITDRHELNDLFAMMTAELSASHHYVRGGDRRAGEEEDVLPASLGADVVRDANEGGHRVTRVLVGDPDLLDERSPLARPGVGIMEGDVILAVNGRPTVNVPHIGALLRDQAGKQVLLSVRPADRDRDARDVIVEPLTPREDAELRYDVWTHERRLHVDTWGEGDIGYLHMRAMGGRNYSEFVRHFFPVFNRRGLIVDMRGNRGGNIDSWVLGFLQRKPWMWWKPRRGEVYHNMQYAFAGHMVVLCDEHTWSDGEAFCEGFRRLGLGPVIGTRTGGGEIWLTSSNDLVDNGIATAAEFGVYGPEGDWLIEGHGVVPDIEVDNLPHATYNGHDAQLEAAVRYLQEKIRAEPIVTPTPPAYPDKSSVDNRPEG